MDPIGLGFENFDAIGVWRTTDNGAQIDASGQLDGASFGNAWEMAESVASHTDLGRCLARNMYRYATGSVEDRGQRAQITALGEIFVQSNFNVKQLIRYITTGPGFRTVKGGE